MPIDITSANSKLRIVVPSYYPGGFDVDDYAADNMFETGALQNKETQMSADGKFHAGFVFNPTEFTITLMPTSNAGSLIDDWLAAERTAIASFACNATLTVWRWLTSLTRQSSVVLLAPRKTSWCRAPVPG